MTERVVTFGPHQELLGVVSEPENRKATSPAVIFLNAGLLHHVGPFRMNVECARALAHHGILSLRFDLSDKGDSESRRDTLPDMARSVADIKEALSFVERKYGVSQAILVGLCSGADEIHGVGPVDQRICGAVLLDACGYPTIRFRILRHVRRIFSPQKWASLISRILQKFTARIESLLGGQPMPPPAEEIFVREFPPPRETRQTVETMLARGARLLYVYTGGAVTYYNYETQFFDALGLKNPTPGIELVYYPNADHTYSRADARQVLLDKIVRWIVEW